MHPALVLKGFVLPRISAPFVAYDFLCTTAPLEFACMTPRELTCTTPHKLPCTTPHEIMSQCATRGDHRLVKVSDTRWHGQSETWNRQTLFQKMRQDQHWPVHASCAQKENSNLWEKDLFPLTAQGAVHHRRRTRTRDPSESKISSHHVCDDRTPTTTGNIPFSSEPRRELSMMAISR